MIRTFLKPLSFLPALCLMYMIFTFSAQDGDTSAQLSYKVSYKMVEMGGKVLGADFQPWEIESLANRFHGVIRKLAHMTEYFALAVAVSFPLYVYGLHGILLMLAAGFICVAFAFGDEYHQSFVAGRGPSSRDVLIDSFGVFWGIILVRIIGWTGRKTIFRPLKKKKQGEKQPEPIAYQSGGYQQPYPGGNYQQPAPGGARPAGPYQQPAAGPAYQPGAGAYRQPYQDAPNGQNGAYQQAYQGGQNGAYRQPYQGTAGGQSGAYRQPYQGTQNEQSGAYRQPYQGATGGQSGTYRQPYQGAPKGQPGAYRQSYQGATGGQPGAYRQPCQGAPNGQPGAYQQPYHGTSNGQPGYPGPSYYPPRQEDEEEYISDKLSEDMSLKKLMHDLKDQKKEPPKDSIKIPSLLPKAGKAENEIELDEIDLDDLDDLDD